MNARQLLTAYDALIVERSVLHNAWVGNRGGWPTLAMESRASEVDELIDEHRAAMIALTPFTETELRRILG